MDYAHKEYQTRFGREPRAYGVQTMRYDVDSVGNIRGLYTQILEETSDGKVVMDDTERHWPADLVLLSIGFEGVDSILPKAFDVMTKQNKIVANDTDYRTNQEKIFAAGDARRGQSLVVWAIKEGRAVAQSVDKYLKQRILV